MNDPDVYAVTSVDALQIRRDDLWSPGSLTDWIEGDQLYCCDEVLFITAAEDDPVTGDSIRLIEFCGNVSRTVLRAAVRWVMESFGEPAICLEAADVGAHTGIRCVQVMVERSMQGIRPRRIECSSLNAAPEWVHAELVTSLERGAASRDLRFDSEGLSCYLDDLRTDPAMFCAWLEGARLAAVGSVGESEWTGAARIDLIDLLGTDFQLADGLLAGTAEDRGISEIRGRVSMGSADSGPRVLQGLLASGWRLGNEQVLAPARQLYDALRA